MKIAVQMNSFDCEQFNYCCKLTGKACELATEFGYCKTTVCTKKYDDSPKNIIIPAEEQKYE